MFKHYRSISSLILLIAIIFNLTACATSEVPGSFSTPRQTPALMTGGAVLGGVAGKISGGGAAVLSGAAVGAGVGGLLGLYADSQISLIKRLHAQGVQVVRLGDNVTIIIPSDRCFEPGTAGIDGDYDPALQNVAALLKTYGNVAITVTGYTDDVMDACQAQILTRAQADSIVAYMWAHGIAFQRMCAVGRGVQCPIAQNDTVAGSAANRRIEITLRQGQG